MPEAKITMAGVNVAYGSANTRVRALANVSLEFTPGTLTLIMGPSGSGKTTLLTVLGCLLQPDSGRVVIGETDVTMLPESERTAVRRRSIGFIFQSFRLFRALSAWENVMLAADVTGVRREQQMNTARVLLETLGINGKSRLKPNELSGGEKQRVAIARALLNDPAVLLADEPTASLDSTAGQGICEILRGIAEQRKSTVVVVSHDPRWSRYAHRTVTLADGRVIRTDERGSG